MKSTVQLVLIVISFAFLGIGNTLMQVSLNPLLTVFVKGDKLASTLDPRPVRQGVRLPVRPVDRHVGREQHLRLHLHQR